MPPPAGLVIDLVDYASNKIIAGAMQVLTIPRSGDLVDVRNKCYVAVNVRHAFRAGTTPRISVTLRLRPQ